MLASLIRAPVESDAPHLLDMGQAFFAEAGHESEETPFDPASFAETLGLLARAKLLLVVEKDGQVVGMAAADVAPAFWNRDIKIGREAFFYVRPGHRKGIGRQILSALELAAKDYGASIFDAVAEQGPRNSALAETYRRAGYALAEHTFRKKL